MDQNAPPRQLSLVCVGLSHHRAPIALRERVAFPPRTIPRALAALQRAGARECLILSTCNRVELYAKGDPRHMQAVLGAFLARYHGVGPRLLQPVLYQPTGQRAVAHLFQVATSLDSMALGEAQILGQLKMAYRLAHQAGTLGPLMHHVFCRAFTVAKRVRTNTELGRGAITLGAAAAAMAKQDLNTLRGKCVVLIGAGKMSELVAPHLQREGALLHVVNRSRGAASALAERWGAQAHTLRWALPKLLAQADVVMAAASGTATLITKRMVRAARQQADANRPLVIVDMAVPRSVEPAVGSCSGVRAYHLDHLRQLTRQGWQKRHEAAARAGEMVARETEQFMRQLRQECVIPLVKHVRRQADRLVEQELRKTMGSLGRLSPVQRQCVEQLAHNLVNKVLHQPITQLKALAGQEDEHARHLVHIACRLFGVDTLEHNEIQTVEQTDKSSCDLSVSQHPMSP